MRNASFFSEQLQIALKAKEPLRLAVPWACAFCLLFTSRSPWDVHAGMKAAELWLTWNGLSRLILLGADCRMALVLMHIEAGAPLWDRPSSQAQEF